MANKQRERIIRYRQQSFMRQGGRCYYCNRRMWEKSAENMLDAQRRLGLTRTELSFRLCTAEHLIRKADGGTNSRGNIVAACSDCNCARNDTCPTAHRANRWQPDPQDDPEIKLIIARLQNIAPRTAPAIELYAKARFLRTAQLAREMGMEVAI